MKNAFTWILILLNVCACFCLVYYGCLFVSGNNAVDNPDAMLPMERWERGGMALTIGTVPLIFANALGYLFIDKGNRKSRLLVFIPSVVCVGLAVYFWIKSLI